MTSSGTYAFSPSNGEMILAAFERVRVHSPEIRAEHMTTARREVNFLLSSWSNKTPNLWTVSLNTITLTQGGATYSIPANVVMVLDGYYSINTGQSNQTNRYITPISRSEYATYANPQTQAPPTVYWFDRLISPTITFYPTPDGNGPYVFNYYAAQQIQDANLPGGETPNVPYRFLDALVADMAHRFSRAYAPDLEQLRKADAKEAWEIAATQDTEGVPLTIAPAIGSYYRR